MLFWGDVLHEEPPLSFGEFSLVGQGGSPFLQMWLLTRKCASVSSAVGASRGKVSTKYFGEVSCTVAGRLDRAQSLWLYSDGFGLVHGYRSQPLLARCSRENSSNAHLSRGKMLAETRA